MQISWLGTFCRLLVVLLIIGFFSWGAWKLSQPANIWTSNSEIQKTESDVRGIHRDAEKARAADNQNIHIILPADAAHFYA